jgi:ribosomal protein L16 Arg81 hydroxylase
MLILAGCKRNDGVPGDILPRDRMEKVLWDMIQADEYSNQYLSKDSTRINVKKETIKLYGQVLQINKVSKEDFKNSFQYYLRRPDLEKKMFDTLFERARRQRTAVLPKPIAPKPKAGH